MPETKVIRGQRYEVLSRTPAGECGPKYFGRYVFIVRRTSDGTLWRAYGKQLAHNSTLTPES
ncbi:hypothetical protein IU469_30935 [Nocardia puris]|uniref:Uncharacterized protein n=1 Tax=Nocardia puris TaxID=208602 RepID=A0A366CUE5_9NOCA|nr:hypothetical protein [Nocardia puris]MBF6370090.1 hypothetical protein [Nocardia puris]RBO79935.1 hypothetical protein DFR74_12911 [Nocardia puris]